MKIDVIFLHDGSATYSTIAGDVLDQIARSFYGTHVRTTEILYEANRHVSRMSPILPIGVLISLPYYVRPEDKKQINLWD
jgi:phage tail protein X